MKKIFENLILLIDVISLTGCANFSLHSTSSNDSFSSYTGTSFNESTTTSSETVVAVNGVTLNKTSVSLIVGEVLTLKVTVLPNDATNKTVNWSTSNESVVEVKDGVITGKSVGEALISVSSVDGNHSTSCQVVVSEPDTLNRTKINYTYEDFVTNNIYSIDNCPLVGNPKLLIVPIWFNDSSTFILESNKETIRNDIEIAYFGSNEETGWRSVKTYYQEASSDKANLTGTVSEWYSIDESFLVYASSSNGTLMSSSLVNQATNWYFSNHTSENKTDYDTNGDGYLDGVILIYGAPDYFSYGKYEDTSYHNLWAYTFWVQNSNNDVTILLQKLIFGHLMTLCIANL